MDKTEWKFSEISNQDIKNVRLACKWFRANASHLVDQIRVDISVNSVLRFETMCSHLDFQRGVQAVEICLAQYDSRLTDSLEEFAEYHIKQLERYRPNPSEMMIKVYEVLAAWRKFLLTRALNESQHVKEPPSIRADEWDFIEALVDGYRQYCRNFREQQTLIRRGVLAPRVAAALAELQHAMHLELTDWETIRWGDRFSNRLRQLDISTNTALSRSLSQWRIPFDEVEGHDAMHVIPELLSELHPAGKSITSLNIQLSPTLRSSSYLNFFVSRPRQLRQGLSNLRSFRFEIHPASVTFPVLNAPASRALANFFDQCLDSTTLESFIIDAGHTSDYTTSLINGREWPVLKYAELKNLATTEADLDALTVMFLPYSRRMGFHVLVLHWVHLINGTWDGAFNTFTARDIMVSLGTPRGRRAAEHARLRLGERNLDHECWPAGL